MKYFSILLVLLICGNVSKAQDIAIEPQKFGFEFAVVGKDMPDAFLQDTLKQQHRLSEYLGKYILLNFWDEGCKPCIKAFPELKEISEKYADRLTVISIALTTHRYSFRVGTQAKGITWVSLWDSKGYEGIAKRYHVKGIPHFVCISPEGKVLKFWTGYGDNSLKYQIKEFLE